MLSDHQYLLKMEKIILNLYKGKQCNILFSLHRYGNKLVLVASQQLRNKALCISTCIDKFYDLTRIQYVMLERIGRSRRMGEITQGKVLHEWCYESCILCALSLFFPI